MPGWIWLIIGVFIGYVMGIATLAAFQINKRDD